MDEILIGEKKYVSSKRAAKMTGYAKDYIGQLCREGRVPARLVGRSWYVLESAIEDHRFAEKRNDERKTATPKTHDSKPVSVLSATWETPKYETSTIEVLPPINHIKNTDEEIPAQDENKISQYLQDSWREWFDRVGAPSEPIETPLDEVVEEVAVDEKESAEEVREDVDTNIPIHVVYEPPPRELLPVQHRNGKRVAEEDIEEEGPVRVRTLNWLIRPTMIVGGVAAVLLASLAIINTGYFDKYLTSISQVRIITGLYQYIK